MKCFSFIIAIALCVFLEACAQDSGTEKPEPTPDHTEAVVTPTPVPVEIAKIPEKARELVQKLTKKNEPDQQWFITEEGIVYHDVFVGEGNTPKRGVAVHMIVRGILKDGTEFVNTTRYPERKSFTFTYGTGATIKGFESGIASMKEKGKRVIVIPPEMGFGDKEYKSQNIKIPPNSTLIFEVSIMFYREAEWEKIDLFK